VATIALHDTLTRSLSTLPSPDQQSVVTLYVCGPTVYDDLHVGNFRTLATFDVLRRFLERSGYEVRYAMNLTDIDDKLIRRAAEEGTSVAEVAERYTERFLEDQKAMGIMPPHHMPRATQFVEGMVELIQALLRSGHAYARLDGSVYFRARSYHGYGQLSGQDLRAIRAGYRIEADPSKEDPADFALWKGRRPGEPWWPAPWGEGRPGWHTECAVMSQALLGRPVDVHGGGVDLIFPHHENERAQAECSQPEPFVRRWVHGGLLLTEGEKASKSLGNVRSLRELRERYDPMAIRLFFLTAHYAHPLNLTEEALAAAQASLERMRQGVARLRARLRSGGGMEASPEAQQVVERRVQEATSRVDEALRDNLNAPQAAAALYELGGHLARWTESPELSCQDLEWALERYLRLWQVLGVEVEPRSTISASLAQEVERLLAERQAARARRDYATADRLRAQVEAMGAVVEDTREGVRWHWKEVRESKGA
jgi:cysteinyl-tRNA synthetase